LRQRAVAEGLANVVFLERRPPEAMGGVYAWAAALLVHLRDDPLFDITIPSKTQACLAIGKPILMGVRGDAADLVRAAEAGIIFAPGQAAALAQAVDTLLAMPEAARQRMGGAGRAYFEAHLSLAAGVRAFEEEFLRAAGIELCRA
jgi:glycosyltransferase involved in cell wall biosynthesis